VGTSYEFVCTKCGYTAEVSGGRDYGMMAVIRTMICDPCKELVEVRIGRYGKDGPTGDPEFDKQLGLCPVCDSATVRPWPRHRPCPKCGGRMTKDANSSIMWD
jgi:hypothetical protein